MSFQEPKLTNSITTKPYVMFGWGEKTMVLKIGTVKESENWLIIGFLVGPGFDWWSNR